jgi:hypothetical protein
VEQANQPLGQAQQRAFHWQQVTENAATCRRWWGDNLEQLAFAQRQAGAHGLLPTVVGTGDQVAIY